MKRLLFLGLAVASISLAACQSKTYKIEGSGDALKDGDTLYLTTDMAEGHPSDTVVVKDGGFVIQGETDSTQFCVIYNPKRQEVSMPFFIEQGTIELLFSEQPMQSKVSGTATNEKWQELNDTTVKIGMKINSIATAVYTAQLTPDEQSKRMAEIEELNTEFKNCVTDYAEKNINNELGCFMLTYYPDEIIDADVKLKLIEKMPEKMKSRTSIKKMAEDLEQRNKYAEGKTMPDFTMQDINGQKVSIMKEIKGNELTIIDFWASWCGPCRAEMPSVVKLYDAYHSKGLGIVGISLDEQEDSWKSAVKSLGMKWTQLSDLKGWQNEAARMFSVESIPHTIVVGKDGTILQRGLRGEQLKEFVASKLK